jgi:hypothetical protein
MNKKMIMILGGAAVGAALLAAAPTAGADPTNSNSSTNCQGGTACNNWGTQVSGLNPGPVAGSQTTYPNRGGYVSSVAQDPSLGFDQGFSGNGYGGQLHDLAKPGNSSPQGTPGTPGK